MAFDTPLSSFSLFLWGHLFCSRVLYVIDSILSLLFHLAPSLAWFGIVVSVPKCFVFFLPRWFSFFMFTVVF